MAILQKIRNKAGVFVLIFVGVALFLFVIDPSTFDALFKKNPTDIAEINGVDVPFEEYTQITTRHEEWLKIAQRTSTIDSETMSQVREQAWNDILRKYLLEENFEDLGIRVSDEEMEDMLWGNHIHSIVQQNFTNPETNMLDTAFVLNYFQNPEQDATGQQVFIVDYLKLMMSQDRLTTKYNTAIAKGLYAPVFLAKDDYTNKNRKVTFVNIARNYKEIPDEEIKVSNSDIEDYYNEYIERFQIEESNRDLEYVVFAVIPSAEDTAKVLGQLKQIKIEFEYTESPLVFVNQNSDFAYTEHFLKQEELPFALSNDNFFNAEIDTISNIYFDNNSFNVSRVIARKQLPDSAQASHILISPDSTISIPQARLLIDSLKELVDNGADFASLALVYSQDPGSRIEGGDLGWFGQGMMVKEFNDACFNNKVGDIVVVETQFGVHLIKVTDQTDYSDMISLATISKGINYSSSTYQKSYADASTFASESNTATSFDKTIVEKQLVKKIASNLTENTQEIRGLEYPREIIRWAYNEDNEEGSISEVFELTDMFVVAKLSTIREKGDADVDDVRDQIEPIVIQKKKAEKYKKELTADLNKGMSLVEISEKYNVVLDTSNNISFSTFSIPRYGIEPNIISTAVNSTKGKLSSPIEGNNGVYILKVIDIIEPQDKEDYTADQLSLINAISSRAAYEAYNAIKKKADIEDLRATWF